MIDGIDSRRRAGHANSENANGTMLATTMTSARVPEKLPSGKSGLNSNANAENTKDQPRFLARAAWKAINRAPKLTTKRNGRSYVDASLQNAAANIKAAIATNFIVLVSTKFLFLMHGK